MHFKLSFPERNSWFTKIHNDDGDDDDDDDGGGGGGDDDDDDGGGGGGDDDDDDDGDGDGLVYSDEFVSKMLHETKSK